MKWETTAEDAATITQIADRAVLVAEQSGCVYEPLDARMDITACHLNGCPLRLQELLDADSFNFSHDVFGIAKHIDRRTGKLTGHFLPRFYDATQAKVSA